MFRMWGTSPQISWIRIRPPRRAPFGSARYTSNGSSGTCSSSSHGPPTAPDSTLRAARRIGWRHEPLSEAISARAAAISSPLVCACPVQPPAAIGLPR